MTARSLLRRLLIAFSDDAPAFRPAPTTADGGVGRRLLVALTDASPAFALPANRSDDYEERLNGLIQRYLALVRSRGLAGRAADAIVVTTPIMTTSLRRIGGARGGSGRGSEATAMAASLARVLSSLVEIDAAVLRIEDVLILKAGGAVIVHELTFRQLELLEENPRLLKDPDNLLDRLSELPNDSAERQ
jgi:hypothetical protein